APTGRGRIVNRGNGSTKLPVVNFVDTWIAAKQDRDGIKPTAIAGDEEFLRRVTLDLTGEIPDTATVNAFLADNSTDKRAKKIDALLKSEAFVDRWTMWFGDLVQNVQAATNSREYYVGRNAYYNWTKDSIRSGKPYDQMVREALSGRGDSFSVGTANYAVRQLQNNGPPQDTYDNLAAHSGERFLGMPLLCLSCHSGTGHLETVNTYLRGKTRSDFWGMAAFFARTRAPRERYTDPNNPNANIFKFNVSDAVAGNYTLNTTDGNKTPRTPEAGQSSSVTPKFILTGEAPRTGENYRDAYGRILTADRQFARATVNYLWKELFGLGIVEPANSFDLNKLATQPTHPELLEALTDEFIAKGYNVRELLRTMTSSSTYQLSAKYTGGTWNEAWVPYYARRYPHRLMSEMLLDAIVKATGVTIPLQSQGIGNVARAMQLADPLDLNRRSTIGLFLNNFGRGNRDDVMRTNDSSISQALALMNDVIVTTRIKRTNAASTVAKTLASTSDPGAIADQLYLATLSRKPTSTERQQAITHLQGGDLGQRTEDLQYALLNSLEFLFN
ncbi:MAG TPA: DUF1549 domain-containing protein, partial [Thermoanaerobaculia bacterium]|nr:DUF1549 domain-containing protein [Thermoanaerobaculia bacterium]